MQKKKRCDKCNHKLRQSGPDDRRANLIRFKTVNRQRLRDENNGCKKAESEESQRDTKENRVPLAKVRKIHQGIGTAQAASERSQEKSYGAEEQAVEKARAPPVKTLPLVERGKQKRESGAGVKKARKAERGSRAFSRWRRWN